MVKYKLIGRTTWQSGKTLWEIIGNLKDHGVGRLVTRGTVSHYKEPCFYKIVKVEAFPLKEEDKAFDRYRKCIVFVERVFRGLRFPELAEIHRASYKPDFRLIPKDEEKLWYQKIADGYKLKPRQPPTHLPVPPTLKLILNEEKKCRGEPIEEEMLVKTITGCSPGSKVFLNAVEEKLDMNVVPLVERPPGVSLYDDIEAYRTHILKEETNQQKTSVN